MSGPIVGRDGELAEIARFLDGISEGPAALLVEGEVGCGKTTLWRAGIEAAAERGLPVLVASPTESESRLSFAVLGDLLDGVLEEALGELPEPQRHALEVALLRRVPAGRSPDERAVATAFLAVARTLAQASPLLVAVDDVQWVDSSSAAVLGFAWRRLSDERVGLLVTHRADEPAPIALGNDERSSSLEVSPLSLGAIHRLLQSRLDLVLSRPALRRVFEVSGGNAFFALEFGRALARREATLTGGEPLPVPAELRELVRDRLVALPGPTRSALAATAALSQPTFAVLAAAGGGEEALRPAFEAHVLEAEGDRLRFTHPLLASAAYEDLDAVSRRRLHRLLASLVSDEEERSHHLALAAEGPDPEIADALERVAAHARSRGATAAAAELCEQALRLTPPEALDAGRRRAATAASYHFAAGDMVRARTLFEEALASEPAGAQRAEVMAGLGLLHLFDGEHPRAAELCREALAEPGADERTRADAATDLGSALLFMREDLEDALELATLGADLAAKTGDRLVLGDALGTKGVLECLVGRPEAATTMLSARELGDAPERERVIGSPSFHWSLYLLWTDGAEAAPLLRACHEDAVVRGDESSLPLILAHLALAAYLGGRWAEAANLAEEGYEVALQTGQPPQEALSLSVRALVRASLGLEAEARRDAADALALAGERAMAVARIHAVWALGLLELSLDRPSEAAHLLAPQRERLLAAGVREPGTIRFVPDEIEALITLGRLEEADARLGWLDERARTLGRVSALAAAARCSGLLASARGDHEEAIVHFERALSWHEGVPMPFERGRTLLALGGAQRRAKRKRAARESLGQALSVFENLGAAAWIEKSRVELGRIGGRAPSSEELTPAEERVALLVAEGRTNKEVAAALFVTDHTVEFHLTRIYRKLGVRGRAELAHRLPDRTGKA